MFSLATGAALEILIAPFRIGEVSLARQLYPKLLPVLLADRAFGSYVDLVLVPQYSADAVFRKHQSRKSDFRRGKKLGIGDHIVTWSKPQRRPRSMSQEEFAELPDQVRVREVHLMAYNLLRTVMWQAGKKAGVCPVRISWQGTRQHLGHFCPEFYKAGAKKRRQLYSTLLRVVTDHLLPERPYRYEPRLKKQRPKPYGWIQQPRDVLKRKLAA